MTIWFYLITKLNKIDCEFIIIIIIIMVAVVVIIMFQLCIKLNFALRRLLT